MSTSLPDNALPQALECPLCGVPTFRLKRYDLPVVAYLIVYVIWTSRTCTGCPSCLRKKLLTNSLGNVVTAHVASPLILLWNLVLWTDTFRQGHAREIQATLQPPTLAEARTASTQLTLYGATFGALLGTVVGILLGLLGGALGLLLARQRPDLLDKTWCGELGAALGGVLGGCMLAGSIRHFRETVGWLLIGGILWAAVRWTSADTEFSKDYLHGSGFSWTMLGAELALLAGCWGRTIEIGTGRDEETFDRFELFLLPPSLIALFGRFVCGRFWGPALSGAVGGAFGGACGGAALAGIGIHTGIGTLWGAGIGALLGAVSGFAGGLVVGRTAFGSQSLDFSRRN